MSRAEAETTVELVSGWNQAEELVMQTESKRDQSDD